MVLDPFNAVEHAHCQRSKEPSTETNEGERQEDEDDVRTFERHQEVDFVSSLTTAKLTPYSIKLYAWDYAFMSRVMKVRNDEELKNLRKIGIVGVHTQQNYFRIKLKNDTRFQSVNFSLWAGIPCKSITSSVCLVSLMIYCSPRRLQFFRHCRLRFPNSSDCRHYLPGDLIVYASSVSACHGEFLRFHSPASHSHPSLRSQWLSLTSWKPLFPSSAFLLSSTQTNFRPMRGMSFRRRTSKMVKKFFPS